MRFLGILLLCVVSCAAGNFDVPLDYSKSKSGDSRLFLNKYPMSEDNPDPIILDTSSAKTVDTLLPFILNGKATEPVEVVNNGESVDVSVIKKLPTGDSYLTGGVFGTNKYLYKKTVQLWTNDTTGNAGTMVDGESYPMNIEGMFYNEKYGSFENAQNKTDGLVKLLFLFKICPTPNLLFEITYSRILQKARKEGSRPKTILGDVIAWFASIIPPTLPTYIYPGTYIDDITGQRSDGVPVILIPNIPLEMCFSENQFKETYGSFKDSSGQPLTRIKSPHSSNGRPILKAGGLFLNIVRP
ncbi:uncharacterized protein LOC135848262 [Planococcus citri]|uniref:uncharacterized protein LOC135848262 n=1 Tax=Planococcus citri TaxID=170843 RepID=UPI0031F7B6D0